MSVTEFKPKLQELQARHKTVMQNRETVLREYGIEERKLAEAVEKLKELGIEDADKLSTEAMTEKVASLEAELKKKIAAVEAAISEAEELFANRVK